MSTLPVADPALRWDVNALLPYAVDRQVEETGRLAEIKRQLFHHLERRNYAPGAVYWTKQLHSFLDLKYNLPMVDRKALVMLFFELATAPGMDLTLVAVWSHAVTRLMEKTHLFVCTDFSFPWRPIYRLLFHSFFSSHRHKSLNSDAASLSHVVKMLRYVRAFFSVEPTTTEVLEELLPRLYPNNMTTFVSAVTLLSEFLPTHVPAERTAGTAQLAWPAVLIDTWSSVLGVKTCDTAFMDLFSRLAFDHYGRDAYRFSDEQIRFVFSMGMKLMELPVGSGLSRNATGGLSFGGKQTLSSGHNANRRVEEAQGVALFSRRRTDFFRLFAEFVVFTIYPADCRTEDAETSTFAYLVNLIRVVEDFYHPSNSGRWSNSLIVFLHYLMISLHDRADRERYSRERPEAASSADNRIFYELPYAESHHLDRSMIRRIILLVRKPLFMALFSKDQRSVMTVCSALNHIAWMEPDLILPGILEKVYPSLETHSEAHRLLSCMSALGSVSLPLIHRVINPSGATHVLPLMELLDMNDPTKTSLALLFYMKIFVSVPLVEVPVVGSPQKRARHTPSEDEVFVDDDYDIPPRDADALAQYDEIARDTTRSLENFVQSFMARLVSLIENMPALSGDDANTLESSIANLMPMTCEIMFSQLSPAMFQLVLSKVQQLIRLTHLPHAAWIVSSIVGVAVEADSAKTTAALLPLFIDKIMEELEHGAGANPTVARESMWEPASTGENSDHSSGQAGDRTLVWYLTLLADIIRSCDGRVSLKWKSEICAVADSVWKKCRAHEPIKLATKIVRGLIGSMSRIYLLDNRGVGQRAWDSAEWQSQHYQMWGVNILEECYESHTGAKTLKDLLDLQWHVPNDDEKTACIDVLRSYVEPELVAIRELIAKTKSDVSFRKGIDSTSAFAKSLTMLVNLQKAMGPMIGDRIVDAPEDDVESSTDSHDTGAVLAPMDVDINTVVDSEDMADYEGGDDDEGSDCGDDTKSPGSFPVKTPLQVGYCFEDESDPRYQYLVGVRHRIGDLLHEMIDVIQKYREDDTESAVILIKMTRVFLTDRGIDRSHYENVRDNYSTMKAWMKPDRERESRRFPRYVLAYRALLQHRARMKHNTLNIPPNSVLTSAATVKVLLDDLLNMSLSGYAVVRCDAQALIASALRCYPTGKYRLLPKIFDAMDAAFDTVAVVEAAAVAAGVKADDLELAPQHNTIKGGLYLILSKTLLYPCLRDWKYLTRFALCLGRAQLVDKPSIQGLVRKIFLETAVHFTESKFALPRVAALEQHIKEFGAKHVVDPLPVTDDFDATIEKRAVKRRALHQEMLTKVLEQIQSTSNNGHWRFQLLSGHILGMIAREDVYVRRDVLAYFLENATSEMLPLRQASVGALGRMMYNIKKRSLQQAAADSVSEGAYKRTVMDYDKPIADYVGQLIVREMTEKEWEASEFVDYGYMGWWCWPKEMKLYRGGDAKTRERMLCDRESSEAIQLLKETFMSETFWAKHLKYASQETTPSQQSASQRLGEGAPEENFSYTMARYYAAVFQLFEDDFFYAHIAPTLETWMRASEKSHVRAAAEIVAGVVRGMKHWPWAKQQRFWSWFMPLLKHALGEANMDTIPLWNSFFFWICCNRDPRRLMPILQLILRDPDFVFDPRSDSSFNEAKKLYLRQEILRCFSWRLRAESDGVLDMASRPLNYAYKLGRELLASNFWLAATTSRTLPSFGQANGGVRAFVTRAVQGQVQMPISLDVEVTVRIRECLARVRQYKQALSAGVNGEKPQFYVGSDYSNGSKIIIRWINECMGRSQPYLIVPLLLENTDRTPSFFTDLVSMTGTDDTDLDGMAISALSFIPECQFPLSTAMATVAQVINTIEGDLLPAAGVSAAGDIASLTATVDEEDKTRRKKLLALAYLQVFFFRHLAFAFDGPVTASITQLVSKLLRDRSVEVRQMAAITLGGLVRCGNDERVVEHLLAEFKNAATTPTTSAEQLIIRHSGVLGMSALALAHPYEIPRWLPDTLVLIGRHASDPAPINATVKHTFAEFRRTHQDSWYEDVLRAGGGPAHTEYSDLYDYTPTEKASTSRGARKTEAARGKKGVFTAAHLEALEGLLTSSGVNYYV